ncbi:hypothetical protein Lpp226_2192 [Lacticaseibacillus paracasei subsp. paracasei Lpp226]|nr:hypothetical protein Lpp226_2192 [Lacticaseibacillus paracasei subsp. paracasei Lpp226]
MLDNDVINKYRYIGVLFTDINTKYTFHTTNTTFEVVSPIHSSQFSIHGVLRQQTANEFLGESSEVASLIYDVKAPKRPTACQLQHHFIKKEK